MEASPPPPETGETAGGGSNTNKQDAIVFDGTQKTVDSSASFAGNGPEGGNGGASPHEQSPSSPPEAPGSTARDRSVLGSSEHSGPMLFLDDTDHTKRPSLPGHILGSSERSGPALFLDQTEHSSRPSRGAGNPSVVGSSEGPDPLPVPARHLEEQASFSFVGDESSPNIGSLDERHIRNPRYAASTRIESSRSFVFHYPEDDAPDPSASILPGTTQPRRAETGGPAFVPVRGGRVPGNTAPRARQHQMDGSIVASTPIESNRSFAFYYADEPDPSASILASNNQSELETNTGNREDSVWTGQPANETPGTTFISSNGSDTVGRPSGASRDRPADRGTRAPRKRSPRRPEENASRAAETGGSAFVPVRGARIPGTTAPRARQHQMDGSIVVADGPPDPRAPSSPNESREARTFRTARGGWRPAEPDDSPESGAAVDDTPGAFALNNHNSRVRPRVKNFEESLVLDGSGSLSDLRPSNAASSARPRVGEPERAPSGSGPDAAESESGSKRRNRPWGVGVCLLAGIAIVLVVLLMNGETTDPVEEPTSTTPSPKPSLRPTEAPTSLPTSPERLVDFVGLLTGISGSGALADPTSPQSRALRWLANEDPLSTDPNDPSTRGKVSERYLAALLYFALGVGDTVTGESAHPLRSAFLTDRHVCEWNREEAGISCGDDGRVSNITMEVIGLAGTIPDELCWFGGLRFLDLSGNSRIGGAFPETMGNCTELVGLDLSGNNITGSLPSSLSKLSRLESLSVVSNGLTGTLPPELSALAGTLSVLQADGNNLSGFIPSEFGGLTKLTELTLSRNRLGSSLPSELGGMTSLRILDASNNFLEGQLPPELGSWSELETIDLRLNQLTGTLPVFPSWIHLVDFDLRLNFLEGSLGGLCDANTDKLEKACADCATGGVDCACCLDFGCCS